MQDFNYHRPASVADAVKLLKNNPEATLLSGGMTIIPTMKLRLASPSDVIDLGGLNLSGISVEGGAVTVKACTTHAEVAGNKDVTKAIPALADLAAHIGDPHVRNRGTIGGSVANNDPAADYPAALVALKATVVTDQRQIAADEFFTAMFETALADDEIITAIKFQAPKRAGYAKFPNPASHYAMVGVFVAEFGAGDVRVAVTGAGDMVFRVAAMEQALAKDFRPEAVAGITVPADGCLSDMHGSAEYRAHLVNVMAKRAVTAAAS
ncbi:MAG TPA: xanthine dehydrogenase family protein subunit M [Aestuariivirgaceae bacterium]|nr:xanthine dehydrogenase family protein subunit M [Aestuariivirgaceae bacterium]